MCKEFCRDCAAREAAKKAGLPEFVTVHELSERFFNISPRRIQQIAGEGWIPKAVKGKYRLYDCITGYIGYLKDQIIAKHVEHRHE